MHYRPWLSRPICQFVVAIPVLLSLGACQKEAPPPPPPEATPTAVPVKAGESNRPPMVTQLVLTPEIAKTNDSLQISATGSDPDGDSVTFQYQWFYNGERLLGEIGQSFPESKTNHGDRIAVEVTPFDGKVLGTPQRTAEVVIKNTAPTLDNQLTAGSGLDGFKFQVSDADNDPITFRLEGAPPNMSLSADGVLHFKPSPTDKAGEYNVKVVAEDGQGADVSISFPVRMTAPINPH